MDTMDFFQPLFKINMSVPIKKRKGAAKAASFLTVSRPALVINGSDEVFRDFINELVALCSRLLAVRKEIGGLVGLPYSQFSILVSIAHLSQKGDVTVSDIASELALSNTFVTTETGKMQKLGLLHKISAESDRRKTHLSLTETAYDLLLAATPIQAAANDVLFAHLAREDFLAIAAQLPVWIANANRSLLVLDTKKHEMALATKARKQ
jgi:DNA-binding MarR family transcriptional regulator